MSSQSGSADIRLHSEGPKDGPILYGRCATLLGTAEEISVAGDCPGAITPFIVDISQERIDDLHRRLRQARLPERETVEDWSQGIPLDVVEDLRRYWLEEHDWRRLEAEFNALGQWQTVIDGLNIRFFHVQSPRADARPLLITHGWPGSVVEHLDIAAALTNPPADQPAFHLVLPSLPGFGFTERPAASGWGLNRIADAWSELMRRLGYETFLAQGGDWGAMVTATLAVRHPQRIEMLHTTVPWAPRPADADETALTELERDWLDYYRDFRAQGMAYAQVNATRPQMLGYALVDSPVGQLAWLGDFLIRHSDADGVGNSLIPRSRIVDNVALYWFTATGASSARIYRESLGMMDMVTPITVPAAVSIPPKELMKLPKAWTGARFKDLRHWTILARGGHFAALETPGPFVDELRQAFSRV
jgi:pimeloyl-ACP methyl ester carboxylesterase